MDDENATPFYEHVFLDKHLGAFPKTGPIRGFMELVILGLGKNPHLSVKEKTDHIKWFEEYFREKQPLVPSQELLAEFEKDKWSVFWQIWFYQLVFYEKWLLLTWNFLTDASYLSPI